MGSEAYGCATEFSDKDIYGYVIPPKGILFPTTDGHIPGFGIKYKPDVFDQYQEQHIIHNKVEYDFSIYNIVRYFQLCLECNPNMLDSLFVPNRCILHSSKLAQNIRDKRNLFIHKGYFHKAKGYAFSQMHKIKNERNVSGKRKEEIEKYGFSLKFAYHVVRLMYQAEQVLIEGTLDLERERGVYKAIRQGDWSLQRIEEFFEAKEKSLEQLYLDSRIPNDPSDNEKEIRNFLLECLEEHYGSLDKVVTKVSDEKLILDKIKLLVG
jgi:predicted nucleotidyltransferase